MKLIKTILWIIIWPLLGIALAYGYQQLNPPTQQSTQDESASVAEQLPAVVEQPPTIAATNASNAAPKVEPTTQPVVQPTNPGDDEPIATESASASPRQPLAATVEARWEALDTTGGGGLTGVAFHPTNPDIVYVASDNSGLYKTENGGDSWFSVTSNLGAYRLGFVTLDPLNPAVIYVTAKISNGHMAVGGDEGEMYRSLNEGQSWQFISDKIGFQSSFPSQISIAIPVDENDLTRFDQDQDSLSDLLIVAAWSGPANPPVGGIWRSEDEGQTFTQVALNDQNMTAIEVVAGDPTHMYAVSLAGKVFKSTDLGLNWSDVTTNLPLTDISDLAIHPENADIVYVTCRVCKADVPSIWRTVDGGQSWNPATGNLPYQKIAGLTRIIFDRFNPEKRYVSSLRFARDTDGVYQTDDGGETWQRMPLRFVLPDGRPFHLNWLGKPLFLGQAIDGTLFTSGSGVWRYPDGNPDDGEMVWEPATLGIGNVHVKTIKVDPQNPAVLYQGLSDFGPYKSIDGGQTFHRILGTGWPVTLNNYVWNGPYYSNYDHCDLACSASCTGAQRVASGGTIDFAISKRNSDLIYSTFVGGSNQSDFGGINKSIDGGAHWQPLGFQLEDGVALNPKLCVPYGFRHLALDSTNDDIIFATQDIPPQNTSNLYKSTDGGLTWTTVLTTFHFITDMALSEVDPNLIAVASRSGVYLSEAGGANESWQLVTPPGISLPQAITFSPHQREVIALGTNAQGLFYSNDLGQTWTQNLLEGLFAQATSQESEQPLAAEVATAYTPGRPMLRNISALIFDPSVPDTLYVSGRQYSRVGFGAAKITNQGQTWQRLPLAGLDQRNIFEFAIDSEGQYLYAGTFNGTYRLPLRPELSRN